MLEDETARRFPAPGQRGSLGNTAGVNVMAAEGLHTKLRRVFNRPYMVENPAADTDQRDHQSAGGRAARGAFVWQLRERPGLPAGEQPADPPHPAGLGETHQRVPHQRESGTAPAGDRGGRSPQAAQPRDGRADHFQHHRPRNAQVLRHPADRSTSALRRSTMRSCRSLGTRISGWLGDDDDIRAVLSGLAGREALRGMLARLQPKEEVLLLGWGVPMPMPVRSRRYDEQFWEELLGKGGKWETQRARYLAGDRFLIKFSIENPASGVVYLRLKPIP